jgi:cytochrome c556
MNRTCILVGLLIVGIGSAFAQNDPIHQREQLMKTMGSDWYGDVGKMMKGSEPYDQAKVKAALDQMVLASKTMPALFPDSAKTGEDTHALPAIWEKKADFNARWTKIGIEASAAQSKIVDLASLKEAQPNLNKNCNECHTQFRAKPN